MRLVWLDTVRTEQDADAFAPQLLGAAPERDTFMDPAIAPIKSGEGALVSAQGRMTFRTQSMTHASTGRCAFP
jgi:hypothetical protein